MFAMYEKKKWAVSPGFSLHLSLFFLFFFFFLLLRPEDGISFFFVWGSSAVLELLRLQSTI